MEIEDEVRDLRARMEAAEHVIIEAVAWLLPSAPTLNRQMFFAGLETVAKHPGLPMKFSDAQAVEYSDHIVMMQSFLTERLASIRAEHERSGQPDPSSVPPEAAR